MNLLLCAGGTAGHVSPAIAIAEIIKKRYPSAKIAFVGRRGGEENRQIENNGYKLYTLRAEGISRKNPIKTARALFLVSRAMKESKNIFDEFKPDLVIGTGGYVCYAPLKLAAKRKIKALLHESNAVAGLVTRLLCKSVDTTMLNLEAAKDRLKNAKKIAVVGNPLRKSFASLSYEEARKKLGIPKSEILIVSFGGSGGAASMNRVILEVMKRHSASAPRVRHIHATGFKYYNEAKRSYPSLVEGEGGAKILPYLDNAPELLCAADITITRSGAMTLSELAAAKCAAILIPSPNVTDNHQYENARAYESVGGAIIIEESQLSEQTLTNALLRLEADPSLRLSMKNRISKLHRSDTDKKILDCIVDA